MQGSRRIFDFLAEEMFDRQEKELRTFLLETSILSSLRPEVCDALTGRLDSGRVLEDLYPRNLYVVAADEAETSFRYHDLFVDFLRERLRRERPDDWAALHERAASAETSPHQRLLHLLAARELGRRRHRDRRDRPRICKSRLRRHSPTLDLGIPGNGASAPSARAVSAGSSGRRASSRKRSPISNNHSKDSASITT
jgi:hypothetical protein